MADSIHAAIRRFLQEQNIVSLLQSEAALAPERYTKAGVVPFIRSKPYQFYVMKPRGTVPELGAPPFQLCKGTRQHHVSSLGWRDIKEGAEMADQYETLGETALREGIEELGLDIENITRLFDLGDYGFASATTGRGKQMWLFAAEVANKENFLSSEHIAATTEERNWLTVDQFTIVGREDHRYILADIERKLAMYFKE